MLYDTHSHTYHSDGKGSVDELCRWALQNGLSGITVTDHSNLNDYLEKDVAQKMLACVADVRAAQEKYKGRLEVLCGIELGEYWYSRELAAHALSLADFDFVLCSVHYVPNKLWDVPYHKIQFSEVGTDSQLSDLIGAYFDLLLQSVEEADFDSLAHITCPVRYMTGRHGRRTDVMVYEDKIRTILKKLIARGGALEYNTCCLRDKYHFYDAQHSEVFALYRELGGKLVTIGSDAHLPELVGNSFDRAKNALRQLGFENYYYYKNRKPIPVKL